jgi:hypothetical protein
VRCNCFMHCDLRIFVMWKSDALDLIHAFIALQKFANNVNQQGMCT